MPPSSSTAKPTIHLDTTLTSLYHTHCPSLHQLPLAHIFACTNSLTDLTPTFHRNHKYIYQDSHFNESSTPTPPQPIVDREIAPKFLTRLAQRDAFVAGRSCVVFFYREGSEEGRRKERESARALLGVLDEGQRPEVVFCEGPGDVGWVLGERGVRGVTLKVVLDEAVAALEESGRNGEGKVQAEKRVQEQRSDQLQSANETAFSPRRPRLLVHPDTLYFLNSKEALATSPLPTPRTTLLTTTGHPPPALSCCSTCSSSASHPTIPPSCSGLRRAWLDRERSKILSAITTHPLPFVVKNQQSFTGAGTYLIHTETERQQLLKHGAAEDGLLERVLCRVTGENARLRPGTVLLMEMVERPRANIGLTFFVGEGADGNGIRGDAAGTSASPGLPARPSVATFLGASTQLISPTSNTWLGSTISYTQQPSLKATFTPLIEQTAAWLATQGYVGPVGADVLVTEAGEPQIVDLNVRTSGSLCLALLRGFFFEERGLGCATVVLVEVEGGRAVFEGALRGDLEAGRVVVLAWFEEEDTGRGWGDVVVAGRDEGDLEEVLGRLKKIGDLSTEG